MNAWAGNLVPASLRVPSGRLLVCITAQGGLLLKITYWRFVKVVQRATIATVGCCPTPKHVVRDDRATVKIEPCIFGNIINNHDIWGIEKRPKFGSNAFF